jgi:hypothetical protein
MAKVSAPIQNTGRFIQPISRDAKNDRPCIRHAGPAYANSIGLIDV